MSDYNPYTAALSAAAAELISPTARRYYIRRSQQDIQTIFILIVQFGCMAYELGAATRQFADDYSRTKYREFSVFGFGKCARSGTFKSVNFTDLILANSTYTLNYQRVGNLQLSNPTLVADLTVECSPIWRTFALPPVRCAGLLMPAKSANFADLNIRELRKLARERGIKRYSSMSKARLVELLSV